MEEREILLALLSQEETQVLALAYTYAKNLHLFGVDITKTMETATEQCETLNKAYLKGYADGLKDIGE